MSEAHQPSPVGASVGVPFAAVAVVKPSPVISPSDSCAMVTRILFFLALVVLAVQVGSCRRGGVTEI